MTNGVAAAQIVADLIAERDNAAAATFIRTAVCCARSFDGDGAVLAGRGRLSFDAGRRREPLRACACR